MQARDVMTSNVVSVRDDSDVHAQPIEVGSEFFEPSVPHGPGQGALFLE